jgi:hypothetical protein
MKWGIVVVLAAFASVAEAAFGQGQGVATGDRGSRAAHSVPNLSGVWAHPSIPGYEPLDSGPTSLRNLSRREGGVSDNRQLVGDYRNPILKPQAADIVKQDGELSLAGITFPSPRNQCWPGGVPYVFTTASIELLQQPNQVVIIYSNDNEVRHIRLNQAHPANATPSWYGDSVGHYEGDTLVVDTIGQKVGPFAMLDWYGTPHSPELHVIERYRLVDYAEAVGGLKRDRRENFAVQPETIDRGYRGKFLQLTFTVEDPEVFTMPWTATMTYQPRAIEWLERTCAEARYKYGTEKDPAIPTAAKPDF